MIRARFLQNNKNSYCYSGLKYFLNNRKLHDLRSYTFFRNVLAEIHLKSLKTLFYHGTTLAFNIFMRVASGKENVKLAKQFLLKKLPPSIFFNVLQ